MAARLTAYAGLILIALGIGSLAWSHALNPGWWEGTLQALGVGLAVGGLVDVLAIAGLSAAGKRDDQRRAALNRTARLLLDREGELDLKDPGRRVSRSRSYQHEVQRFLGWYGRDLDPVLRSRLERIADTGRPTGDDQPG